MKKGLKNSTNKKRRIKGQGQILNHSSKTLLVIENDSGTPIAHILGPMRKSPSNIDADGFKRSDGKSILFHKHWWKVPDFCKANIFEFGKDFLMPVSIMIPVSDNHFGAYKIIEEKDWGEKLTYVTKKIQNKNRETIAYLIEDNIKISLKEAIKLTRQGKLDNVIVVKMNGREFLRTKKNTRKDDNLTV